MRQRSSRSLAEFVELQFWDFSFFWTFWTLKRFKKDSKSKKTRLKHEHSLKYFWMYVSWFIKTIKSLQRTTQRRVLRLRRTLQLPPISCRPSMHGRHGRHGYFRSWEDLPRDCFRERFGLDGSFQRRLFGYQWSASDSRTELAAGWVGAFWPILDEEPYQFPNKLTQKSQKSDKSHNTNHMHPTHPAIAIDCWIPSIPSMTSNPSCIDWDDTA